MDRSKIPKVGSTKTTFSRLPINAIPKKIGDACLPPARNILRRRSKSVTDMRPLALRPLGNLLNRQPLTINEHVPNKNTHPTVNKATASTKIAATKRAAPVAKNDDIPKAKVARKIPDWDYKSRFLDLQTKFQTMKNSLKASNSKLEGFAEVEQQLFELRSLNTEKSSTLEQLQNEFSTLQKTLNEQHETHKQETKSLNNKLEASEQKVEELLHAKQELENKNKELQYVLEELQKKYQTVIKEKSELESQNATNSQRICSQGTEIINLKSVNAELLNAINEHEFLRRQLHNHIQDLRGNIRVFCRVRPPAPEEDGLLCTLQYPTDTDLEISKSRESIINKMNGKPMDMRQEFGFDRVFPPETSQEDVFKELAQLLQSALDGYNVCVFAYGQTGSGKTYTMQGPPNNAGMIPRAIEFLFENIRKLEKTNWKYAVRASFLEIYNENVNDLLEPNSKQSYNIKYNEGRGVTVSNLKIVPISSAEQLLNFMTLAHKNRAVAATNFNEHSSRSHAITKIELEAFNTKTNITYSGSVSLVDLAGSESAKTSTKERIIETKNINKSLSTLGLVMIALHNKDTHIPYRNSKLTFLLQSCLGGNSKTLMFVHISPAEECFAESINSLRFAAKVKEVKTVAKKTKLNTDNSGNFMLPP